jgi:hypothetical protein
MSIGEHFAADAARDAIDRLSDERDAALQKLAFAGEFVAANEAMGAELVAARALVADLQSGLVKALATIERVRALADEYDSLPGTAFEQVASDLRAEIDAR